MNKGAKIVSEALAGIDFRTFVVNGKGYTVYPPTIYKLAGAISCLSDIKDGDTLKSLLLSLGDSVKYAEALSWFVQGDDSLKPEFQHGTLNEIVNALEICMSMVDIKVFLKAVSLAKSVSQLAAESRQQATIR